jgi:hypothetical protein
LVVGGHCRLLLRSGYLVACGWMLCSPQRLPGHLRMDAEPSTGGCFATTASPTLC